jgi:hypothetical protein
MAIKITGYPGTKFRFRAQKISMQHLQPSNHTWSFGKVKNTAFVRHQLALKSFTIK